MNKPHSLSLPIIAEPDAASLWHGLAPLQASADALDAPEPFAPQGAYLPAESEHALTLPTIDLARGCRSVELLAPAGGPEAAYAAFHFGAEAVYLGLKKFSARAEAENFTLEELDEVVAYAHSLTPRRRVFVAVNTVIRQDELAELVETLAALADLGVDAIILQDLGVYHLARRYFPSLELHGSTQLAVHNRPGAEALRSLGFQRVVLARELTFEEVHDITATAGIETEVFIHGALCYSYSGLCLFSAQTLGRSGNRGKCAYSCRDAFDVEGAPHTLRDGTAVKRDPARGFPFSMKDLALPDHVPALRAAGVSCFKIEGRKKSPLYVATTTGYYRKLIDGTLGENERPELEADMQTVFSRPWTRLFVQSHKDKEVADRDTVGHRGTPIGTVEAVRGGKEPRVRFRTSRALQLHDGLQIDLPALGKPFGFAVDDLRLIKGEKGDKPRDVFEAAAGAHVEVTLPRDHPHIPLGAPIYCSSSQAVKQHYDFHRPKPEQFRVRKKVDLEVHLRRDRLEVTARLRARSASEGSAPSPTGEILVHHTVPGPFAPAKDPAATAQAVRTAFDRLGQTRFALGTLALHNLEGCFVPASRLNQVRRDVLRKLDKACLDHLEATIAKIKNETLPPTRPSPGEGPAKKRPPSPLGGEGPGASGHLHSNTASQPVRWSIKVDRLSFLQDFTAEDWADLDEVIVDVARDHPAALREALALLGQNIGRGRIRLALPAVTRKWEEKNIVHKVHMLRAEGWHKWEAANLSAWSFLGAAPTPRGEATSPGGSAADLDLAADWSLYVVNRLAAQQLIDMGVTRFALSPEDGLGNWSSLLQEFGPRAVLIVYQDTPLFMAESCAYANLIGGCPGKANCSFESMDMVSSHGEKVTALDYHCRTIVLNQGPFCLSTRLAKLARAGAVAVRADFIYRAYTPQEVRERWRRLRAGQPIRGSHAANCDRGIL